MEISPETNEQINKLLDHCSSSFNDKSMQDIVRAFEFAHELLNGLTFETGEVIINHSIEVASIIATEIGMEADSVITGLLHNVTYTRAERKATHEEITRNFGPSVALILDGMSKINSLGTDTIDLHAENYRKLLLALAGDLRVILVKIADRLQVMRHLDKYITENQLRLANETSYLYAPLAHRLGLYKINSELQDLCLKYQKPKEYEEVLERLKETEEERRNFTAEFVKPIEENLLSKGFRFEMKARTKSIFSIWNKMKQKGVSFDEILDLFAIRIILETESDNEKADCWAVYSVVTDEYQANPERLRDWITIPKSNGYESLHTTVMGPHGKWVEVQIRTQRMDEIAEKGFAAHWKYKGGKSSSDFDKWLAGIRDILDNPEMNINDFIDDFRMNIYSDEIFVFTPKGDLKKLPKGATILDFAYEIHSNLGDKCVGGKVNGRKVTLRYKLKNGDQVAVETSTNQKPKLDWLDIAVTSKAKTRIKSSLNEEKKREAINGREILVRKFKNWKIELSDVAIRKMLKKFNFKLAADLYYNISTGKIDPLSVKSLFTEKEEDTAKKRIEELLPKEKIKYLNFDQGEDFLIIDNHLRNVNYKLAPCCNPVFGDEIFGFVTIKEGIKIHRLYCPNAAQMTERYPYRVIKAMWRDTSQKNFFLTTLYISGTDKIGIVSEITNVIAKDLGVQMRSINIETKGGEFEGVFKVLVSGVDHLDYLIHRLKNINGIQMVNRTE